MMLVKQYLNQLNTSMAKEFVPIHNGTFSRMLFEGGEQK